MKKSTYIIIGFLVFFLGTILALHIDSKNYEDEYIIKMKKEIAISKERNNFYAATTNFRNNKSLENWNDFVAKSKLYFVNTVTNQNDYNTVSGVIATHYRKYSDTASLRLAKGWAKKGMELNPKDGHMNDTYATVLFNSGDIEEAIEQQTIAVEIIREENHRWTDLYMNRLERYKNFLTIKRIKVGEKYIDANLFKTDNTPIKLSNLIDNKVTILAFWKPFTKFSPEKNRFLIPIYQNNRDKGLQVIGITGAQQTSKALNEKIIEEHLPWINLIDANWKEQLWDKYGILSTDNTTVLIDKNGTIVSIGATEKELKIQLYTLLNK
jgi:peroxiredoxin